MNSDHPLVLGRPGFWSAVRGMWVMTWRTRLTWRRVPQLLLSLLALPALIYISTIPVKAWADRHQALGNPNAEYREFVRLLGRSGHRLNREQQQPLRALFHEEFTASATNLRNAESATNNSQQQQRELRACYERIRERCRSILDDSQLERFDEIERERLQEGQRRASMLTWGRTDPFYHCLIDFYLFVIVPLLCVSACGALIREEVQANTLCFLTTRPLSRARLLLAKYLCQTAWLQLVMLVGAALLFAAGFLRQVTSVAGLLPLFLAAQILAVPAWSALGMLLGLISKRYLALALLYGFIVEMGIGRIPTNINTLSLMRHLKTLLAHNPDLQRIYEWSGKGVSFSIGALLVAAVIFSTLSAVLFTLKEYHHTVEMQK